MDTANTEKKGINKNLIIIIAAVAVAIIALVVGCIFIFGDKTYRVLKIYQVEGQASVVHNDGSEVTPYENMLLQSGDQISLVEGTLIIKADEDKYIYLENNTTIILEADGSAANSRTSIQLLQGAVINQIDEPLSSKSVYELNTQNATMSVRGTIFRAEVFTVAPDEDDAAVSDNAVSDAGSLAGGAGGSTESNVLYTTAQTLEGLVETDLINDDGSRGNQLMQVSQGKMVTIRQDAQATEYQGDMADFDIADFKSQTLKYLGIIKNNSNKDLGVTQEELEELQENAGPFTVTFMNDKDVFGTVVVEKNEPVEEPLLMPTASGNWDFTFGNTVSENTVINWQPGK